jgi:hypothetical protein
MYGKQARSSGGNKDESEREFAGKPKECEEFLLDFCEGE